MTSFDAVEIAAASAVMASVRRSIRADARIMLPPREGGRFISNPFGGDLGPYRYQFEGEDDLLHLIVIRADGEALPPDDARNVAGVLFEGVANALIWFKPGTFSHHFYVGHDDLLGCGE